MFASLCYRTLMQKYSVKSNICFACAFLFVYYYYYSVIQEIRGQISYLGWKEENMNYHWMGENMNYNHFNPVEKKYYVYFLYIYLYIHIFLLVLLLWWTLTNMNLEIIIRVGIWKRKFSFSGSFGQPTRSD